MPDYIGVLSGLIFDDLLLLAIHIQFCLIPSLENVGAGLVNVIAIVVLRHIVDAVCGIIGISAVAGRDLYIVTCRIRRKADLLPGIQMELHALPVHAAAVRDKNRPVLDRNPAGVEDLVRRGHGFTRKIEWNRAFLVLVPAGKFLIGISIRWLYRGIRTKGCPVQNRLRLYGFVVFRVLEGKGFLVTFKIDLGVGIDCDRDRTACNIRPGIVANLILDWRHAYIQIVK